MATMSHAAAPSGAASHFGRNESQARADIVVTSWRIPESSLLLVPDLLARAGEPGKVAQRLAGLR